MVRPDRQGWWKSGVDWIKEMFRKGDGGLVRHDGGDLETRVKDWVDARIGMRGY